MTCLNRDESDLRQRVEQLQTDLSVGGGDGLRLIPTYAPGKYYTSPLFSYIGNNEVGTGIRAVPFPVFETINITGYAYWCHEAGLSDFVSMAFYTDHNGTPGTYVEDTWSGRMYAISPLTSGSFPAWRTIGHQGNSDSAQLFINTTLEPGNYWLAAAAVSADAEGFIIGSQDFKSNMIPMHHYDARQVLSGYDGTWEGGITDFEYLGRSGNTLGGARASYAYYREDIVPLNSTNSIDLTLPVEWHEDTGYPPTPALVISRQTNTITGIRYREALPIHAFARIGAP